VLDLRWRSMPRLSPASTSQFETMFVDVRAFEIRILASSIEKQLVLDAFMQI
jgi:hypothetical protein